MYLCMIKYLILFGILCSSTSIGWYIRKIMVERQAYFEDLVKFCEALKQNIGSKKDKISIFVMKYQDSYHQAFRQDIQSFFLEHHSLQFEYLQEKEKKEIMDFFTRLGSLPMHEEIANITSFELVFQQMALSAKTMYEKYGNLVVKLSSLAGAIICIILL